MTAQDENSFQARSGLLRVRVQVVGSDWVEPKSPNSTDSFENIRLLPERKVANEILESLVSGFNLNIQYYIKFGQNTWTKIAQKGLMYTGMWYV